MAAIASAMYHIAPASGETTGDTSININLAQFDDRGNPSKDEFDTYRIEYKPSENGGIGECRVYEAVSDEDWREITVQDANLDTCNILGRLWDELYKQLAESKNSR